MAARPRAPSNESRSGGVEPRLELKDDDFPALPPAPASPAASPPASTTVAGSPGRKDGAYANDSSSEGGGPWARQPSNSSSNHPARKKSHHHGHPGRHGKRSTAAVTKRGVRGRGSPRSSVGFGDDLDERSSSSDDEDSEEDERQRGWRIRLAPWNTPLHRRLQTAVVLLHCLGMGLTFSFFCFLCTMPLLWPVLVAYYFVYVYLSQAGTDGRTGRRVDWLRRSRLWVHFANYFPARLHKTADLPPTRKYIFAVHPHGIISHGAWAAFATEALGFSAKFPGVTNSLLTLNGNFKTPFYREYLLAMGLLSVSKESITNALTRGGVDGEGMGNAVSIVVGGAREALEGQPRTMRLIIERRGFCRMAIRTGADLVPVLAFGENDLYAQWGPRDHPWFHSWQKKALALLGFSVPVLQGRGVFNYDFGILPHRRPLNIVVGAPIKVRQEGRGADDLERETENLHRIYVQNLEDLYHRYKDVYFKNRKEELVFVDRK